VYFLPQPDALNIEVKFASESVGNHIKCRMVPGKSSSDLSHNEKHLRFLVATSQEIARQTILRLPSADALHGAIFASHAAAADSPIG